MSGQTWSWLNAVFGMAVVVIVYIVFDYVIWDGLAPAMDNVGQPIGFNSSTHPVIMGLHSAWNSWAIPFLGAWGLYMVVVAFRREPGDY